MHFCEAALPVAEGLPAVVRAPAVKPCSSRAFDACQYEASRARDARSKRSRITSGLNSPAGLRAVAAAILKESLEAEAQALALALFRVLLRAVKGRSVALEEDARHMIQVEEMYAAEVDKMLKKPGDMAAYSRGP